MARSPRPPSARLLHEVRTLEVLASEIDVPMERMTEYWNLSLELIALTADIEEMFGRVDQPDEDDGEILALRHRLRSIAARLTEMERP